MTTNKINNKLIFLIPALFIAGILACLFLLDIFSLQPKEINSQLEKNQTQNLVIAVPYNWPLFYKAIDKQVVKEKKENKKQGDSRAVAAIAPHHDLAAEYTAELFALLSSPEIETVIIIGPNHENIGSGEVITGLVDYRLFNNSVKTDEEWVKWLEQEKLAVSGAENFLNEHAIYALVPFIKYYFPEAKIVPIILKSSVLQERAIFLGQSIADRIAATKAGDKVLIIGSIDFSHYLSTEQAKIKDMETQEAILERNYQRLYSFGDDHIDSPPSAVTVLSAATRLGGDKTEIIANVNQAEVAGLISVPSSTSYFTIIFSR